MSLHVTSCHFILVDRTMLTVLTASEAYRFFFAECFARNRIGIYVVIGLK